MAKMHKIELKILLNKQKRQMVVENMLKLVPYMMKTIRAAENIMNSNQKQRSMKNENTKWPEKIPGKTDMGCQMAVSADPAGCALFRGMALHAYGRNPAGF